MGDVAVPPRGARGRGARGRPVKKRDADRGRRPAARRAPPRVFKVAEKVPAAPPPRPPGRPRRGSWLDLYLWKIALLLVVACLIMLTVGPTLEQPGLALVVTGGGLVAGFGGLLVLAESIWVWESSRRAGTGSSMGRGDVEKLRRELAVSEGRLTKTRALLRGHRHQPAPPPPTQTIAGQREHPRRQPGSTAADPESALPPIPIVEVPVVVTVPVVRPEVKPGVSVAVVPGRSDGAVVAVFIRWNRYHEDRARVMESLAAEPGAETLEFPLTEPNDFHGFGDITRVLSYRVAAHPEHGAGNAPVAVVHLRLGEFDETSPASVLVDDRALWTHAEGLLDRPDELNAALDPPGAAGLLRGLGSRVTVDRLTFANDAVSSFLVREIAALAGHNPAFPVPRLYDLIVNRAFVRAGLHRAFVREIGAAGLRPLASTSAR